LQCQKPPCMSSRRMRQPIIQDKPSLSQHHIAGVFKGNRICSQSNAVTFPSTISRWPSILLSGYFSTAILCKEIQCENHRLKNFSIWRQRGHRIHWNKKNTTPYLRAVRKEVGSLQCKGPTYPVNSLG